MTTSEAVQLISKHLEQGPEQLASLRELVRQLGQWPLLLELANATLRHRCGRGDSLQGALDYLRLKLKKQGVVAFDARNSRERQQAIARTLDLSLELLNSPGELERSVELAVFPEDADIPLEAVQALWNLDAFDAGELLQIIDNTSLIRFDVGRRAFRIHDVVSAYLQTKVENPQALHARLAAALTSDRAPAYFWRWRNYHLMQAGQAEAVHRALLDYSWMRGKLAATDLSELIGEYQSFSRDDAIASVSATLKIASPVLLRDSLQLPVQLLGRLLPLEVEPSVRTLLEAIRTCEDSPWLEPVAPILTPPGGALQHTLAGHAGPVLDIALLKGGKELVSAGADGEIRIWDLTRGKVLRSLKGHRDWVRKLVALPDGTRVLSACDDGTLRLWDVENGVCVSESRPSGEEIYAVAVNVDARTATIIGRRKLTRWSQESGVLVADEAWMPAEQVVLAATAGGQVLFATMAGSVGCFEASDPSSVTWLDLTGERVQALGFDGRVPLIVAGGRVSSWDENEHRRGLHGVAEHSAQACSLDANVMHIVTGGEDGVIRVWDRDAGACTACLEGHNGPINAVILTDNRGLISASDDGTVRVWALDKPADLRPRAIHRGAVRAVCFAADGYTAFSTSDFHELLQWNAITAGWVESWHGDRIWSANGGELVAAWGSPAAGLHCWRIGQGPGSCRIVRGTSGIRGLEVSFGAALLSCDGGSRLIAWDLNKRRCVFQVDSASDAVQRIAASVSGRAVAVADVHGYDPCLERGEPLRAGDRRDRQSDLSVDGDPQRYLRCRCDRSPQTWHLAIRHARRFHAVGARIIQWSRLLS